MERRKIPTNNNYLRVKIETANPMELILIMYDGAIINLKEALKSYKLKQRKKYDENLTRAKRILKELQLSLNMDAQPISGQLYSLYDYMMREICDAICNRKENKVKIEKVKHMLTELRDAWNQIQKKAPVEKEKRTLERLSLSI